MYHNLILQRRKPSATRISSAIRPFRKTPICAYTILNCISSNSIRVLPLFYDAVNPTYAYFFLIPNLHLATKISRNLRTPKFTHWREDILTRELILPFLRRRDIFDLRTRCGLRTYTCFLPNFVFFVHRKVRTNTWHTWAMVSSRFYFWLRVYTHGQCFNWIP